AIPRLIKVQFKFYFSRGGGVYTRQNIEVATLKTWPRHNRALLLFVDIVFLCMCLASTAFMAREFSKDMKAGKIFGHFNLINSITWLSCLFGFTLSVIEACHPVQACREQFGTLICLF
ncbi:pkd2, partial [Symbiodinium necroappetens]